MCMMGASFAKGAFFALKSFNGGGLHYRLVRANKAWPVIPDGEPFEVLDTYGTGNIRVNTAPTEASKGCLACNGNGVWDHGVCFACNGTGLATLTT